MEISDSDVSDSEISDEEKLDNFIETLERKEREVSVRIKHSEVKHGVKHQQ